MNDEDVSELSCLLSEMTRHIPRIDDDDLIEHLRGGVEPVEDFHPGNGAGITGILNRLAEKETFLSGRRPGAPCNRVNKSQGLC